MESDGATSVDVLIVGAGWAGLSCASALHAEGLDVSVLEKGRGPGGRCATRRHEDWSFNHGAQYFTTSTPEFAESMAQWQSLGLVRHWDAEIAVLGPRPQHLGSRGAEHETVRWVGVGGNNAVLRHLAEQVPVHFQHRVELCEPTEQGWLIEASTPSGSSVFLAKALVMTAPPRQTADLVGHHSSLGLQLKQHLMKPTWALMLGFDAPSDIHPEAAFVNAGPIAWFCRQARYAAKSAEAWVVHATHEWSSQYLELNAEDVADRLLQAWLEWIRPKPISPAYVSAHRWRYAISPSPLDQGYLSDRDCALWVLGDWCLGNRVEGAWLSGQAAAKALTSEWFSR